LGLEAVTEDKITQRFKMGQVFPNYKNIQNFQNSKQSSSDREQNLAVEGCRQSVKQDDAALEGLPYTCPPQALSYAFS